MARSKKTSTNKPTPDSATTDYRHDDKRPNIPPAHIAGEGQAPKIKRARYAYSPHLPPELRFDLTGKSDKILELADIAGQRALTDGEQKLVREALKSHEPWLEWATKKEQHDRKYFEVDPVVLHIHERVSAQAIVKIAARQDVQRDLFADPQQPYQEAVQFYRHDMNWANRLILGDSLQVMSSLAKRENLAGKIQMIYLDPPYGIKFGSNFQPEVASRDVLDTDQNLTREVETVRAFRDTWRLGIHSYLGYLRDRLIAARELLSDTGSLFVQIGQDNAHRVRVLLDEVFGADNFVNEIVFVKTTSSTSNELSSVFDVILWYRRTEKMKFRRLFERKRAGEAGATGYKTVQLPTGEFRPVSDFQAADGSFSLPDGADLIFSDNLTSQSPGSRFDVLLDGRKFRPEPGYWKTDPPGMRRLLLAGRVLAGRQYPGYLRKLGDFPAFPIANVWSDTLGQNQFGGKKVYTVQTALKVIERCMLMTTDPGDLVLDPTCGSGSTALVAEEWGRRWISIDTSRVALAIARQRLLTASFEHYRIKDSSNTAPTPARGFVLRTVPHIMMSSIGQNQNLDPIFAKHESILDTKLVAVNTALKLVKSDVRRKLAAKLADKQKAGGKRAITDADERRWNLPNEQFEHWTVPFDTDPEWPKPLVDAVAAYRKAWRAKMDAVDGCIAANAEQEDLVDQPEVVRGVVRVSGPFTVEGVNPEELSLGEDGLFDGTPNEFEGSADHDTDGRLDNPHAYLTEMVRLLKLDGVTFTGVKEPRKFERLEPLFEQGIGSELHAEGAWTGTSEDEPNNIAVVFGPQYGPVTALQVENAVRGAKRYDELVIAGFSFAPEATAAIEQSQHPKLRVHQAQIRPDVNPAMAGLLKDTPNSQIFTVFGQPEIAVTKTNDGWVVSLLGVDLYDPVTNALRSTGAEKVAAWFLDSDFDGRCFCVTQAFFPNQKAWEKIAKALKSHADEDAFERLSGTVSLPFPPGTHRRVAVKVIDPRGNEVMAIRKLGK